DMSCYTVPHCAVEIHILLPQGWRMRGSGDSQKPGRCPRDFMRCLRLEPPRCANDSSCPAGLKCCHWECRLRCIPPPSEGPMAQPGSFRERCRGDSDCPDAQKCCNSSCGHQCLPGVPAGEAGRDRMGQDGQ
uniref:WAP domain-containing protein n=1 Tax=Cyanoderma ruficeps TaxID=181631 RepID=A0A8C3QSN7_9PASS